MNRLLATGAIMALLAACNAETEEPSASEETAAPAAPEAEAVPAADLTVLAEGDIVLATRQTQCHEVGPDADEQPWDVGEGSFATVVKVEGAQIRVKLAGTECMIPAADVKPSES